MGDSGGEKKNLGSSIIILPFPWSLGVGWDGWQETPLDDMLYL